MVMAISGQQIATSGHLPAQNLPDVVCHAFAYHELLAIAEGDQPAVAAQSGHLADVVRVDQRISMDPTERAPLQLFLDLSQALRRQVALFGGHDPHHLALSLKCQDLVGAKKKIFVSHSPYNLGNARRRWNAGDLLEARQVLGGIDPAVEQLPGTVE